MYDAAKLIAKIHRRLALMLADGHDSVRFELMVRLVRSLMPEYRLSWYQIDWWKDRAFHAYLERFGEPQGLNAGRHWMVHQLLRLTGSVPGDTAECGVYRGATSYLIGRANVRDSHLRRTHFVFDSFEGLSEPRDADGAYWRRGDLQSSEEMCRQKLTGCGDVVFMKGWIPSRFDEVSHRRFAFVHIDVDLYEPTRDSIAFFYSRLSEGGILLIDDYGFSTCPGATRAVDEAGLSHTMIALSDGGGFLIKGLPAVPPADLG